MLGASGCSPVVAEKVKRRLMKGGMSLYSKWVGKTDVRTLKTLNLPLPCAVKIGVQIDELARGSRSNGVLANLKVLIPSI